MITKTHHKTLVTLPWKLEQAPPPFEGNDIKYPESLVRYILKNYTKSGDRVFDPFAGLGTTLFVAEDMKRIPFGIEAEQKKHEWVAGQLENWTHLVHDDAANMARYDFPKMDLILTSPPYMPHNDKWNPLYGGDPSKNGYDLYLKRLKHIFSKLPRFMKKETPFIVQVDNIEKGKYFTPLIRDIGNCLEKHFMPVGETVILWDNPKPGYLHTHCLIFKKR